MIEKEICKENRSKLIPVGSFVNKLDYNEKSDIDLSFYVYNMNFWTDFHSYFEFEKLVFFLNIELVLVILEKQPYANYSN